METIRAQLSATLTGGSFPNTTYLSRSISQSTPGLALTPEGISDGVDDADIFGNGEGQAVGLSLAELKSAVKERKRARPAAIERQVRPTTFTFRTVHCVARLVEVTPPPSSISAPFLLSLAQTCRPMIQSLPRLCRRLQTFELCYSMVQ